MYKTLRNIFFAFMLAVTISALLVWKELVRFITTVKMDELFDILDNFGHKAGLGGFEGLIGTFLVSMALLVFLVDFLKRPERYKNAQSVHPTDWMDEIEERAFYDRTQSPAYDNLPGNIWYKDRHRENN